MSCVFILPPHHFLIEGDCLQLSINIIFITIFGCVGKRSDLDLTLGDSAHVVILNGDPVHQRPEDLILDLLDAAMLVKVFGVGHHCCGNNLRQKKRLVQKINSLLPTLTNSPAYQTSKETLCIICYISITLAKKPITPANIVFTTFMANVNGLLGFTPGSIHPAVFMGIYSLQLGLAMM